MKKITMENENEQLVVEVKDVEKTITLAKGYNTLRDTLNNASRYDYLVKELDNLLARERLIKKNKQ